MAKRVDPNKVAYLPPEAVALRDGKPPNDGEYWVLDRVETDPDYTDPMSGDVYPGRSREVWDGKAVTVLTKDQVTRDVLLHDEKGKPILGDDGEQLVHLAIDEPAESHFERYEGEDAAYVPRRKDCQ